MLLPGLLGRNVVMFVYSGCSTSNNRTTGELGSGSKALALGKHRPRRHDATTRTSLCNIRACPSSKLCRVHVLVD